MLLVIPPAPHSCTRQRGKPLIFNRGTGELPKGSDVAGRESQNVVVVVSSCAAEGGSAPQAP